MNDEEMTPFEIAADLHAMGYVLYGDRVAFKRESAAEKSKGGIHIPEGSQVKPIRGVVVMIGRGVDIEGDFKGLVVGQEVTFTKYNPLTMGLRMVDGSEQHIEAISSHDLYIGCAP